MKRWLIAAAGSLALAGIAHADSRLADLVQAGDDTAALKLIDAGAEVNAPQADGATALDWAAYRLDTRLVKVLLQHHANPNAMNSFGSAPLIEAIKANNVELVEMLLNAGAHADAPNADGQTALMLAARIGALPIAKLLLRHGANVNAKEQWQGQTALMWAAAQNYPQMTQLLVDHGAKVDIRAAYYDWLDNATQITSEPRAQYRPEGGLTPLSYAIRGGCQECVATLLKAGANVNMPTPEGVTPLMSAIDPGTGMGARRCSWPSTCTATSSAPARAMACRPSPPNTIRRMRTIRRRSTSCACSWTWASIRTCS
jgi:ankyrin repeat protein